MYNERCWSNVSPTAEQALNNKQDTNEQQGKNVLPTSEAEENYFCLLSSFTSEKCLHVYIIMYYFQVLGHATQTQYNTDKDEVR